MTDTRTGALWDAATEAAVARHAILNRDAAIIEAHTVDGHPLRAIAEATGLSHQTIANICNR